MKIVLVGNPNCGKTTLFNVLTDSRAKVGNWSGVTVEKKEGYFTYKNQNIEVIDLPGIYSLCAYTEDEQVTKDFLLNGEYDIIINVVDTTNLERNLYLTTLLQELGTPMIVALNMVDLFEAKGGQLEVSTLQQRLGLNCQPISSSKNIGIDELIDKTIKTSNISFTPKTVLNNSPIASLIYVLAKKLKLENVDKPLFTAINYLDNGINKNLHIDFSDILSTESNDFDIIIAEYRYRFIETTLSDIYKTIEPIEESLSENIDKIVTNKYLGIPLFLMVMYFVFNLTFGTVGLFLQSKISILVEQIMPIIVINILTKCSASDLTISLFANGILPGLGMILTFLPQILIMFLFITFLEDVGYMSRATYLMDHFFRKIGLSGKAFIPMIMGFGCSVPAIMATRTLENKRDRRLAVILTPFISCGARLPIYIVFTSVFFKDTSTFVIFSIYLLGVLVAFLSGLLFKNTILKDDSTTYIMELSPYRLPVFKNVILSLWEKVESYVKKAFTLLLASSIIVWFLQSFDFSFQVVTNNSQSIFGQLGSFISPIFSPLGFETWEASSSLLTGFLAKELVVQTLQILYSSNNTSIIENFTLSQAISFMVFSSLYMPCVVAFATIKQEMQSLKWSLFAVSYQTLCAYTVSLIIYNVIKFFLG